MKFSILQEKQLFNVILFGKDFFRGNEVKKVPQFNQKTNVIKLLHLRWISGILSV